jgi:hypothetical protein
MPLKDAALILNLVVEHKLLPISSLSCTLIPFHLTYIRPFNQHGECSRELNVDAIGSLDGHIEAYEGGCGE